MSLSSRARKLALSVLAFSLIAVSGRQGAGGQELVPSDGSNLSGPPQMNATYQTREPRLCKALTAAPVQAQAAALVQCTMDVDRPAGLFLMQDVKATLGAARSYQSEIDSDLAEIDLAAPVYPLIGSLKIYWCSPVGVGYPAGKNCMLSPTPYAVGKCWKTTFGEWKCNLAGPASNTRSGFPGPTAY
jgi:hypothetical protein